MQKILSLFIEFYSLSFSSITIVLAFLLSRISTYSLIEAFLLSFLLINVGIRGVFAFIGNWFSAFSEEIALKYGWEARNTYQKEIAAGDGALACLGLLSYWFRGDFWTATILATSICWVLSEMANISSIIKGRRDPSQKLKQDYDVSVPIFIGMYIDLLMVGIAISTLIYWKCHF